MGYSEESTSLYSYMQELHRAAILATRFGSTTGAIEIRKKLARVADRYRQINKTL